MPALLRPTVVALGFAFALALRRGGRRAAQYCRSVAAKLKADSDLAAAARAAFGQPQATDDEACLYPLQLLRYADVDVLVSQIGEPGDACHGCEATLSATVLKRVPGGYKRARSFDAFAKGGTFGAVASVHADRHRRRRRDRDRIGRPIPGLRVFGARPLRLPPTRPRSSRIRRAADHRRRQQRRRNRRQQDDRGRKRVVARERRADGRLPRHRRPRQARQPRRVERRRDA